MITTPRKRLCTNIDGVVKSSLELARLVRSMASTEDNTHVVPGWRVLQPTGTELAQVREVQVAESQPGHSYPYLLPRDAGTTVLVESGAVEVCSGDESLGELEQGQPPYFNPRGTACEIRATAYPTTVLLISYRERRDVREERV